jgi:DNA polymerase-3 subunit chi
MPRADFYLIDQPRFRDDPLLLVCELARRAFDAGQPAAILARSAEEAEQLDEKLWSFDPDAYVPHQLAGDEDDTEAPILIVAPGVEVPERPLLLNLREDCPPAGRAELVKEVVAADPAEREGSRRRWSEYKRRGYELRKFDL